MSKERGQELGLYIYRAIIRDVHDGDTITVDVDQGFDEWRHATRIRIAGISARELDMPGGPEARDYLTGLLPLDTVVIVRSVKADHDPADARSFIRYVLAVTLPDSRDLGQAMIGAGYAVTWDGKSKPTPYPPWPIPA